MTHGVRLYAADGLRKSLQIGPHCRRRLSETPDRLLAAKHGGDIPAGGVFGVGAVTNLDPAQRAIHREPTFEGRGQNGADHGVCAVAKGHHDAQRVAVLEIGAQ